jgi:hypothetical protein
MLRIIFFPLIFSIFACRAQNAINLSEVEGTNPPVRSYSMQGGYRVVPGFTCDGFPRVWLETPPGYCVGLVMAFDGDRPTLIHPRGIANIPGTEDFILVDRVSKSTAPINRGAGILYRLTKTASGYKLVKLMDKLSQVHKVLFRGHGDMRPYIGVDHGIFRFNLDRPQNIEWVVTDLPSQFIDPAQQIPGYRLDAFLHALTNFDFDPGGDLYVNVGSPDDSCSGRAQSKCGLDEKNAQVRKYTYKESNDKWDSAYTVFARGLRNSLALAVHATGTVLQGENSIDLKGLHEPFEELNVLTAGGHYGWPYCTNFSTRAPNFDHYSGFLCDNSNSAYKPPYALLPGHVAPLDMLYYPNVPGGMFPELTGKLMMTFHGYRDTGHRIVMSDVDAAGLPILTTDPQNTTFFTDRPGPNGRGIISGRDRVKYSAHVNPVKQAIQLEELVKSMYGVADYRPNGSPVALTVDGKGAIWFTDDGGFHSKETGIFRIARSETPLPEFGEEPERKIEKTGHLAALAENPKLLDDFTAIKKNLMIPNCQSCHGDWKEDQNVAENSEELFRYVFDLEMVNLAQPNESKALSRISGTATPAMPPTLFDPAQRAALFSLAKDLLIPWATELSTEFNRVYVVKAGSLTVRTAENPSDIRSDSALEDFKKCNVSLAADDTVYAKNIVTIRGYQVAQFVLAGALKAKVESACGAVTLVAAVRSDAGRIFMEKVPL